jgi:hypothetical protein
MLQLCAQALPSATKEAVLAALKGTNDKTEISTNEATRQDSSGGQPQQTMPQKIQAPKDASTTDSPHHPIFARQDDQTSTMQGSHQSKVGNPTTSPPKLFPQRAVTHPPTLSYPPSGPTTPTSQQGLLGVTPTGNKPKVYLGQSYYKVGSHQIIINLKHKPTQAHQGNQQITESVSYGPPKNSLQKEQPIEDPTPTMNSTPTKAPAPKKGPVQSPPTTKIAQVKKRTDPIPTQDSSSIQIDQYGSNLHLFTSPASNPAKQPHQVAMRLSPAQTEQNQAPAQNYEPNSGRRKS